MDYKQYHSDWRDVIRPLVLKRDGYCCKHCNIRHKSNAYKLAKGHYMEVDTFTEEWARAQGHKIIRIFLQVAHLDHDKSNNEPSNLLTLCAYCHGKYDSEHKRFKRLLFKKKSNETNVKNRKIKNLNLVNLAYLLKRYILDSSTYSKDLKEIEKLINDFKKETKI